MAGKIDVGWATPPFGVDAVEQGRIRVLAKANDVPKIRDKTDSVTITTVDMLQKRKDVVDRFVQAYRETIEWMYSDPAALKAYAEFAGVPEEVARRMRDEFYTKDMLSPNSIAGLDAIAKEAAKTKQILGTAVAKADRRAGSNPGPPPGQRIERRRLVSSSRAEVTVTCGLIAAHEPRARPEASRTAKHDLPHVRRYSDGHGRPPA